MHIAHSLFKYALTLTLSLIHTNTRDAYFADPNGWAGRKLRVRKGELTDIAYENANVDKKGLALTLVWGTFITGLLIKIVPVMLEYTTR